MSAAEARKAPTPEPAWYDLAYVKKRKVHRLPSLSVPVADTHAHMLSFWGTDPSRALARASLAGVGALVTLVDPLADGVSPIEFRAMLDGWVEAARELVSQAGTSPSRVPLSCEDAPGLLSGGIRYLAGVHPYGAPRFSDDTRRIVEAALSDPLCAGIGEIGLDYHFDRDDDVDPAPHDVQMECMASQLDVAVRHNVPVELHLRHEASDEARTSHTDALSVLREVGVPAAGCVLHCFGEDRATMEPFLELGCSVAFGGAATFGRNEDVRDAFAACPLDRVLFETDCPYMAPHPLRGMECEPAMAVLTASTLVADRAERTGERPEDVLAAAWENSRRMFFSQGTFCAR